MKYVGLIAIALGIVISSFGVSAGFLDLPEPKNEVLLDERDDFHPILRAAVLPSATLNGRGEFFLACKRGDISTFYFNVVFHTFVYKDLLEVDWKDRKVFIGVKNGKSPNDIVRTLSSGLFAKGYLGIAESKVTITQAYTPLTIDNNGTLFMSSFVDSSFLQAFIEGDSMIIATHYAGDRVLYGDWSTNYSVDPTYARKFMTRCMERVQ